MVETKEVVKKLIERAGLNPEFTEESKPKLNIEYTPEEVAESLEKFKSPELIEEIHKELSKSHIDDNNLKFTTFLVSTSGLLCDQRKRISLAITGDSSEGKDNNIKTSLKHMPNESYIFVTSATQSTIEDDIADKRIIAFSEVNANRENGANKSLIEVIKQKTEGGTSSVKKDIRTGMKSARHSLGEQSCVLYGTTEAVMDKEMQTRFIKGTITTDPKRIEKVNHTTIDNISDVDKVVKNSVEKDSWLKIGLTFFFSQKEQYEVCIPYAKWLKEDINGEPIFDHSDPRSQRDLKRVIALTCAMTYLFQEQRKKIDYKGKKILFSEPQDFINTLKIAGVFFNQSYSGLDERCSSVLKIMKDEGGEWIARDLIQDKLGVSRNTIKEYCQTLAENGEIEGNRGKDLNYFSNVSTYNGNRIYYKRCQKGVKKPFLRCQLQNLIKLLEEREGKKIDAFLIGDLSSIKKEDENTATEERCQQKGIQEDESTENMQVNTKKIQTNSQIDTFGLTPYKNAVEKNSEELNITEKEK